MRKPAQAIDLTTELGERLGAGIAEASEIFGNASSSKATGKTGPFALIGSS